MKTLIAYYSRAGENYVSGQLKMLAVGNTALAAEKLQALTGGDLFRIEQVKPYSASYNTCIEEARQDQRRDARPALTHLPEHLADYDVIYLGYPNYWGTMPMAVFTFLTSFDFGGKTICPFCTHEGSGLGRSVADIRRLCPTAKVVDGLALHGSSMDRAGQAIADFAAANKQI